MSLNHKAKSFVPASASKSRKQNLNPGTPGPIFPFPINGFEPLHPSDHRPFIPSNPITTNPINGKQASSKGGTSVPLHSIPTRNTIQPRSNHSNPSSLQFQPPSFQSLPHQLTNGFNTINLNHPMPQSQLSNHSHSKPTPNPNPNPGAFINKFTALFPSLDRSKLIQILKDHSNHLKRSILYILTNEEFKGSFDQSICVYHLSKSCKFESNPSGCRYHHDREVPSAICQFWLQEKCRHGAKCKFLHRIPAPKGKTKMNQITNKINNINNTKVPVPNPNATNSINSINSNNSNDATFNMDELVLMLSAMFPDQQTDHLRTLLAKHAMKIKPVVATLLQYDDYSIAPPSIHKTQSEKQSIGLTPDQSTRSKLGSKSKPKSSNERPVCRYYLMGDCKLLDCMFSHDQEAANAICKYWLWGYCSRKEKCFYKHSLPSVNTQQLQQQEKAREEAKKRQQELQRKQQQQHQHQMRIQRQNKNKAVKPPSDLMMKLRLNSLKESFPQIPIQHIKAAFTAKKYQLEETERFLMAKYGKKQKVNGSINKSSSSNGAVNLGKGVMSKQERKKMEGTVLLQKIGWVPTGDSLNALYRASRNQAEAHARERNYKFMQAVDAYLRGNRKMAKDLSKEGKEHDKEMKRLHRIASQHIFKARNQGKLGLNVIDVHGLHVDEAIGKLKERIAEIRRGRKGKKKKKGNNAFTLDVLTGTGHHSYGGFAKVGPAIRAFAQKQGLRYKKLTFVDGRGGNVRLFIS